MSSELFCCFLIAREKMAAPSVSDLLNLFHQFANRTKHLCSSLLVFILNIIVYIIYIICEPPPPHSTEHILLKQIQNYNICLSLKNMIGCGKKDGGFQNSRIFIIEKILQTPSQKHFSFLAASGIWKGAGWTLDNRVE